MVGVQLEPRFAVCAEVTASASTRDCVIDPLLASDTNYRSGRLASRTFVGTGIAVIVLWMNVESLKTSWTLTFMVISHHKSITARSTVVTASTSTRDCVSDPLLASDANDRSGRFTC